VKRCSRCHCHKELTDFNKNKSRKDGLRHTCKSCDKEQNKEFKKTHPNYAKEYYEENKSKIVAKQLVYYRENFERISQARKEYAKNNKEKLAETSKLWLKNNPERNRNKSQRRRARVNQNGVYEITDKEMQRLYSSKCFYCKSPGKIEADHVVPIDLGGTHSIGNLVPACISCNRSKGKKTITAWNKQKIRSKNGTK
jgi:5-methylcytosine-specific restriction endonuclease McrA